MRDKGGGQVTLAERTIARVCANCFSGAEFIAPKPRPNTVSQFGSRYRRGLGRRALKIMGEYDPVTAIAIRPLTQPRMCGWVPRFFPPWVDSKSWVWLENPSWACHQLRGQMEKNVYFYRGSVYRAYPSFASPNKPGAYPFAHACRYLHQCLKIWCWWWHQSGFTINLRWERHLLSTIRPFPDVPPPLICCSPGGWGVWRVRSQRGRLIKWGIGDHHILHCDVRWRGLHFCS